MTCEAYYETHPEPPPGSDRCGIPSIEAATSRAVGLLGASTTLFGVLNLFVTGWTIKRFGIKTALLISVFWPAVRLAVQNIGVMTGSGLGIIIVQSSQIITILGGPAGYLLALNSYVSEILEPSERTGALGQLQGCSFIGISLAYLAGGLLSDTFGILAPFRVTVALFLGSCVYIILVLPWLPLNKDIEVRTSGLSKFFGPLKIFTPQKWTLPGGRVQTEYGTILLGLGVFLGVLATGYIPVLLQMYATDTYNFGTSENGYLISLNSFVRGLFLTFLFPRLISAGRSWYSRRNYSGDVKPLPQISAIPEIPHEPTDFVDVDGMGRDEEPTEPPKRKDEKETFAFDLVFTRYSLLSDAILTGAASFVSQGWQMYLIAVLLPFASGTGASAKGTILQMCSAAERADALNAITLIEMVARLATSNYSVTLIGIIQLISHSKHLWISLCGICGDWYDLSCVYLQCCKSLFSILRG
jgi:MFS family permease